MVKLFRHRNFIHVQVMKKKELVVKERSSEEVVEAPLPQSHVLLPIVLYVSDVAYMNQNADGHFQEFVQCLQDHFDQLVNDTALGVDLTPEEATLGGVRVTKKKKGKTANSAGDRPGTDENIVTGDNIKFTYECRPRQRRYGLMKRNIDYEQSSATFGSEPHIYNGKKYANVPILENELIVHLYPRSSRIPTEEKDDSSKIYNYFTAPVEI